MLTRARAARVFGRGFACHSTTIDSCHSLDIAVSAAHAARARRYFAGRARLRIQATFRAIACIAGRAAIIAAEVVSLFATSKAHY